MFDSGRNALALQSIDVRSGNSAVQMRVLGEGLEASTTERGPLSIYSGAEKNMGALKYNGLRQRLPKQR